MDRAPRTGHSPCFGGRGSRERARAARTRILVSLFYTNVKAPDQMAPDKRFVMILAGISILCGGALIPPTLDRWKARDGSSVTAPLPRGGVLQSGAEVLVVLVVSSQCGPSRSPHLREAFYRIKESAFERSQVEGKQFGTIGISLDIEPHDGLRFLGAFGSFDEVGAGRGWLNTGATAFMIRGLTGQLATPQVVIVEREIEAEETHLRIGQERLVARYVGLDAILPASGYRHGPS